MVMTEQLQFGRPVARWSDPVTSHLAAAEAKRGAATLRVRVLELLRAHPEGLTDFQTAALLGSQQTSAGKRRGELVAAGLVERTEERRPSPSGSLAIVWRASVAPSE